MFSSCPSVCVCARHSLIGEGAQPSRTHGQLCDKPLKSATSGYLLECGAYDAIQDAILTCAQKLVSVCRTETKRWKTEN